MNSDLLKELEARNHFLGQESDKFVTERIKCSRRVSDIQFILIGMKGEVEANKQVIQKLKGQKKED